MQGGTRLIAGTGLALVCAVVVAQQPGSADDLTSMSLKALTNVEVTSVSKAAEPLGQAPASIYVITHEQIVRSGAVSVPEALRLAPNLLVTQITASDYQVSARGFSYAPQAQNYSNKLLILIDGRAVYNPLFSGVYLDAQDVVLEDVDRIEVISGPGATLWGANAMNGVINIVTRPAYLTQDTLAAASGGNVQGHLEARYGGKLDAETAYRFYGKAFASGAMELADGSSAHDGWNRGQGGFRIDRSLADDTFTVQGDGYRALESQPGGPDERIYGANVLGRWQHRGEHSELQIQAYYDFTERSQPVGGSKFVLHTFDVELQQALQLAAQDRLVWGAGERLNDYSITATAGPNGLLWVPKARNLTLSNLFAENTWSIVPVLRLTTGIKLEDDPYAGWQFQPDVRLAWDVARSNLLWAAASQAVRSPTPFDADVREQVGGQVLLYGNPNFHPERVSAFEIGYRTQPFAALSLNVASFYNEYRELRTVEPSVPGGFFPLTWANGMRGHTTGIEAWADWQVTRWWRLSPGIATLHKALGFTAGSSGILGVSQAGDDPSVHWTLASSMNLPRHASLDLSLRHVSELPDPALPGYDELGARLAWHPLSALELYLTGQNLLHGSHFELPAPYGEAIRRSVTVGFTWQP